MASNCSCMCDTDAGGDDCRFDFVGPCSGDGRTQRDCERFAADPTACTAATTQFGDRYCLWTAPTVPVAQPSTVPAVTPTTPLRTTPPPPVGTPEVTTVQATVISPTLQLIPPTTPLPSLPPPNPPSATPPSTPPPVPVTPTTPLPSLPPPTNPPSATPAPTAPPVRPPLTPSPTGAWAGDANCTLSQAACTSHAPRNCGLCVDHLRGQATEAGPRAEAYAAQQRYMTATTTGPCSAAHPTYLR